jgi:hypothetical protein
VDPVLYLGNTVKKIVELKSEIPTNATKLSAYANDGSLIY